MNARRKKRARGEVAQSPGNALDSLPPVLTPEVLSTRVFDGGRTTKALSKLRLEGGGPVFRRMGHPTRGRVVYLKEDVIAWVKSLPAASTTTEERIRAESCAAGA